MKNENTSTQAMHLHEADLSVDSQPAYKLAASIQDKDLHVKQYHDFQNNNLH